MMRKAKEMMNDVIRLLGLEHDMTITMAQAYETYSQAMRFNALLSCKKNAYDDLLRIYRLAIKTYLTEINME